MSSTISTLEPSLAVILPDLPQALVASRAMPALWQSASTLPPICQGGFEVRLGASDPQIDLQQCILAKENEPQRLAAYIDATQAERKTDPAWQRLRAFCTAWQEPTELLQHGIDEIWLEMDNHILDSHCAIPSVFFGLQREGLADEVRHMVIVQALQTLQDAPLVPELEENLTRCLDACGNGVRVSHVGVMLSRQTEALRVNIKGLTPDVALSYLNVVGWPGNGEALSHLMAWAWDHVDHITVCLDVGYQIYPQIGLECFFVKQPEDEPRWAIWLDALVEREFCTLEKAKALLAWPGMTNPTQSDAAWPDHLLIESLSHPTDKFTTIVRRMNHVKLVYHPEKALAAKGYLWFGHMWLNPQSEP